MNLDAGSPNWKRICINFQCGGPASRFIYSGPKWPADDQTYRHKIKKVSQLNGWTDIPEYYNAT